MLSDNGQQDADKPTFTQTVVLGTAQYARRPVIRVELRKDQPS